MIVTSKGMLNIQSLPVLIGEPVFHYLDPRLTEHQKQIVAGWGRKKSFSLAKQYALKHDKQLVCLEDGFIRSLGLGKQGIQPLSIVVDYTGIYFDSTQASDLENLIQQPEDLQFSARARHLINKILASKITKYNEVYVPLNPTLFSEHQNILVIDQTLGDQSINYSGATATTFQIMLKQALVDYPDAIIWVKTHPDVIAGHAKGHFSAEDLQHPRIKICAEKYNPHDLLAQMQHVYVVSSQMGFEALLSKKTVSCFGLPWYAGWGLTDDRHAPLAQLNGRRGKLCTLEHLFTCAYLKYARYFSPVTHQQSELEDIIDLLIPNIDAQKEFLGQHIGYGFSRWKRKFIADFVDFPCSNIHFQSIFLPKKEHSILAWGKKAKKLQQANYPHIWTVEDGFVRSNGLGANLIRPYSLVFDNIGIYYDATCASKLENILNSIQLDAEAYQRADHLIQKLIDLNITKYNVGEQQKLIRPKNTCVALVTGQVEDDLSVQLGGLRIKSNLELLQQVRKNHPETYIIYKPHPDVHAGLRLGQIPEEEVLKYANHIELKASIVECFEICDEIHTISSLSGFEGLLRGKRVYCYGMPFYGGWGLTEDISNCDRRKRKLTIQQLVYGVLIKYALYSLPQTKKFGLPLVNVEHVIEHIFHEKLSGVSSPVLQSTFAKIRATIVYKIKGN